MKDWDLARRSLLKGMGLGAACLPMLHASRAWSQPKTPRRMVIVVMTNGYRQSLWRPMDGSLMSQTLPDSSSPLEPHKADLIFLPGLTHPSYPGRNAHGAYPNHLTAGPNSGKGEYRVAYSPSVDQVAGQVIAKANNLTRATLNLGLMIDQGISGEGLNSKYCIFRGKSEPIIPEQNPYKTFSDIFGGTDRTPAADAALRRALVYKKSLLDYISDDLSRFQTRLGTDDRAVVGGHMQSIRDLERQLQATPAEIGKCGSDPGMAVNHLSHLNYPTLTSVSHELMLAALRCDVTRVATFQMGDATGANLPWNFLPGIPERGGGFHTSKRNWHDCGHNPVLAGTDHKRMVDKWCMAQLAELLTKMKAISEPNGSLLDNSVVLASNCMEDGQNHNTQAIPWILAGKCGGYFRTGQCAQSAGKPLNGVLADMCNAVGVPTEYFVSPDYGRPWEGLKA